MWWTPLPWLWLWAVTAQASNYCSICPDHTMCIYKSSGGPASRCRGLSSRDLTPAEAQAALHEHNAVRNKVAAGEERRGRFGQSQPPAANMHRLHWDEELAAFARRWASQCVFDQDTCRTSADGTPVGQNIYMQVLPVGHAQHSTVSTAMAVRHWLEEVDEHDGRLSTAPYKYSAATWHYTALVWARTTRVGCGFADYMTAAALNARLIVCNYKEAGNVVDSPAYLAGRPASQCGAVSPVPHAPAVPDGGEYEATATTTSWWQVFPWLPTPREDDDVRPEARSSSKQSARAHARGRRGVESTTSVSPARAAVTRALPLAALPLPGLLGPGPVDGPAHVYPALCP